MQVMNTLTTEQLTDATLAGYPFIVPAPKCESQQIHAAPWWCCYHGMLAPCHVLRLLLVCTCLTCVFCLHLHVCVVQSNACLHHVHMQAHVARLVFATLCRTDATTACCRLLLLSLLQSVHTWCNWHRNSAGRRSAKPGSHTARGMAAACVPASA